jgi:hypothetical protein
MRTIEYEQYLKHICKKIIELDARIRFAGMINERGRLITWEAKEETVFLVDKKDHEMLFMEVALRSRMRHEFDHCLGLSDFTVTYRKMGIIMEFPIENETLYVSAEKGIELDKNPFEILKILKNSD